ncbi:MAG: tetratricopeptide repeat protein [Verrucomicrobia bacterium]|nr:tetratricopeptide repeat protein [Verrucomicrobiota bacterium]MBT5620132.1 tetratricopeptide repeat protein [Verrucomicrobiota bacterium]
MPLSEADQARLNEFAKRASSAFSKSNLAEVRQLYGEVLSLDPRHAVANYWLGYLECREGNSEAGAAHLKTASTAALETAQWLAPDSFVELGMALNTLGREAEAAESFEVVLERFPAYTEGQLKLAEEMEADEHLVESAIDACHRGLLVNGRHPRLLKKIADLLEHELRWDEAADFWVHLCEVTKPNANIHLRIGLCRLRHNDDGQAARAEFEKALKIEPDHEAATFALAERLDYEGEFDEVISRLERLAKARPDSARVPLTLANFLGKYDRIDEAILQWRNGLAKEPKWDDSWRNLGFGLEHRDRIDEAVDAYRQAAQAAPANSENHRYLGSALQDAGQLDKALDAFGQAIKADPENAEAHWGRFWVSALRGDFPKAWEDYEWRWKLRERTTPELDDSAPLWEGGDLSGQTFFLRAEQGYGDTIQTIRYAPILAEMGATVKVGCPPALARLLTNAPGVSEVITGNAGRVIFNSHQALFSLPRILGTTLDNIPGTVPYLTAPSQSGVELPATKGVFRIGLTWHGSGSHNPDRRSVPFEQLLPLLEQERTMFFSLQLGDASHDPARADAENKLADLSPLMDDFASTAALIEQLDLVITIDTAVAHLAGALGKPTWLLLSAAPDWRWMLGRSDSPWYPSMRLFRQAKLGDWSDPLAKLRAELARTV